MLSVGGQLLIAINGTVAAIGAIQSDDAILLWEFNLEKLARQLHGAIGRRLSDTSGTTRQRVSREILDLARYHRSRVRGGRARPGM